MDIRNICSVEIHLAATVFQITKRVFALLADCNLNSMKWLFLIILPISFSTSGEPNYNWLGLNCLPDNTEG